MVSIPDEAVEAAGAYMDGAFDYISSPTDMRAALREALAAAAPFIQAPLVAALSAERKRVELLLTLQRTPDCTPNSVPAPKWTIKDNPNEEDHA